MKIFFKCEYIFPNGTTLAEQSGAGEKKSDPEKKFPKVRLIRVVRTADQAINNEIYR